MIAIIIGETLIDYYFLSLRILFNLFVLFNMFHAECIHRWNADIWNINQRHFQSYVYDRYIYIYIYIYMLSELQLSIDLKTWINRNLVFYIIEMRVIFAAILKFCHFTSHTK